MMLNNTKEWPGPARRRLSLLWIVLLSVGAWGVLYVLGQTLWWALS